MRCPQCDAETQVRRSRTSADGTRVARVRHCKQNPLHRFDTEERPAGYTLDQVWVRQSGNGELAKEPFRKSRVLYDVRAGVLKRLNDAQVYEVVSTSVHDLETHLPQLLQPLTHEEQTLRPGYVGAITDSDITDAVERSLRSSPSSMAHVLYALAIRGRSDREGRPGWADATQVLHWLGEASNYPDLVTNTPEPPERPVDKWITGAQAPQPRLVLKRNGELTEFRVDKFRPGIVQALLGRPHARLRASGVAQWVLWGLAGQSQVSTTQLGVGVLDALRRVDDIAYLRWCIVLKRIESVASFVEEVRGLIESPSPKLVLAAPVRSRPEEVRRLPTG